MIRELGLAALFALPGAAPAQNTAPSTAFEVASVKPTDERERTVGLFTHPGGRVTVTRYTLKMLIHEAYDVEDYKIQGGPAWAETDRYSVEAKPPESSPVSKWVPADDRTPPTAEMRRMLQSLLEERFGLKAHRESKKGFVYVLAVAKGGPKLAPPNDATQMPFVSFLPHGLRGQNATMDQLAERLARVVRRPVLNRTNVTGNFDFVIDYPPDEAGTDVEGLLLNALRQAGLKFETQPGSVDVIVIDHAEKPTAN